ncbi:hypothetical protein B0H13DRAFT_1875963 [Mycena leptocephala]|nr:hypothetical protein B0H13DRAFT_1875963 [Mycena leptocephala]
MHMLPSGICHRLGGVCLNRQTTRTGPHGNHTKKILQGPTTLRLRTNLLISVKDFENETGTLAPYFVHTEKENRKRKANGAVKIEWPNLKDGNKISPSMCLLQDAPFDQSKTKIAHLGRQAVLQHGSLIQENHDQVVKEVTRLSKTGYFLGKFMSDAKKQGVDIEQGIQATDFKLGVEVAQDNSGPSAASGFSVEQYRAARETQDDSISDPVIQRRSVREPL